MFKTELCLKVIGKQAYEVIEPLVYDNGLLIVQVNPKFDFDGARFFLCKAVTTTGSYWVFDSVRGDDAELLVTNDRALQVWWEYSLDIQRDHPMVTALAVQLDLDDEQLDNLFIEGAKL